MCTQFTYFYFVVDLSKLIPHSFELKLFNSGIKAVVYAKNSKPLHKLLTVFLWINSNSSGKSVTQFFYP